jgi:hypothetical protein
MPLSPAPSKDGEILQHGLESIVQHNFNSPYPQDQYNQDEGVHLQSSYGSPTPRNDERYNYRGQQPRFGYQQHQHQDSGLGIQYVGILAYQPALRTNDGTGWL